MATSLFPDIIVGPIKSRRLGTSLGVNLLPLHGKLCNFNCIYCECGWTMSHVKNLEFNKKEDVLQALELRLSEIKTSGEHIDVITFAGNGEPTLHPHFSEIIDAVIELRDRYLPDVKIAVLSNATMLHKKNVIDALKKVDRAILKIDSAVPSTIKIINDPKFAYNLDEVIGQMMLFKGEMIVQTMFLRGEHKEEYIDNTTEEEISAWLEVIHLLRPSMVMIYSIDRDTPTDLLEAVSYEELQKIGQLVETMDIECLVTS